MDFDVFRTLGFLVKLNVNVPVIIMLTQIQMQLPLTDSAY